MNSNFTSDKEHTTAMKAVVDLLDKCDGPYVLLYDDDAGTHVLEESEGWEEIQEMVTAALCVLGSTAAENGNQERFTDWLQRFIDTYGKPGDAE